jgi:hypothetical protein
MAMRRKLAPRFQTPADLVHWETERHFKKMGVDLPPQWESLVILACFPEEANNPASADAVKAFTDFLACDPDLALEVLRFARERRVHFERGDTDTKTKSERVRRFLLREPFMCELRNAKGEKKLHPPFWSVLESGKPFKEVPVASLQDKEVAAFIFGPNCENSDVEIVKYVRQSLGGKTDAKDGASRKRAKRKRGFTPLAKGKKRGTKSSL